MVANKVRSEREEAAVREYCARREFEVIGLVPFDERVTEADHQGRALIDYAPESPAVVAVKALADVVLKRTGTPPTARYHRRQLRPMAIAEEPRRTVPQAGNVAGVSQEEWATQFAANPVQPPGSDHSKACTCSGWPA